MSKVNIDIKTDRTYEENVVNMVPSGGMGSGDLVYEEVRIFLLDNYIEYSGGRVELFGESTIRYFSNNEAGLELVKFIDGCGKIVRFVVYGYSYNINIYHDVEYNLSMCWFSLEDTKFTKEEL